MHILCKSNDGFEDQLSAQAKYNIEAIGDNSYLITNDTGEQRWYGQQHFSLVGAQA